MMQFKEIYVLKQRVKKLRGRVSRLKKQRNESDMTIAYLQAEMDKGAICLHALQDMFKQLPSERN